MPQPLWPSAYELERQITEVRTHFNSPTYLHELKLFSNDVTIDAETELTDLSEADFDGYAPFSLEDEFLPPVQDDPGRWSMRTEVKTWEPPAEAPSQTIYGAYIESEGELVLAGNLAEPVVMEVGGDPLRLRVIYRHLAAALFEQL